MIASGVDCRSYNVSEGVSGTILAKRISSHFALEYRNPALDASLITTKNANVAGTLDASYYKGCGMRSGVEQGSKVAEQLEIRTEPVMVLV